MDGDGCDLAVILLPDTGLMMSKWSSRLDPAMHEKIVLDVDDPNVAPGDSHRPQAQTLAFTRCTF